MFKSKFKTKEKIKTSELPSLNYRAIEPVLDKYGKKVTSFQNFEEAVINTTNAIFSMEGPISAFTAAIFLKLFGAKPLLITSIIIVVGVILLILRIRAIIALRKYKKDFIKGMFLDFGIATTFRPKDRIKKKDFISDGKMKEASLFSGEDYIEGSNGKFDFKFSELSAKRRLPFFENEVVFQGLYFMGNWGGRSPVLGNFKLTKCQIKDSEKAKFNTFYDFYDMDGKYLNKSKSEHLLSEAAKDKLLSIAQKNDYRFDVIFKDQEVFIFVYAYKDFFEIELNRKFNKDSYTSFTNDVLFFTDLVNLFSLMEDERVEGNGSLP